MVARDWIEPPTPAFSGPRSTTELPGLSADCVARSCAGVRREPEEVGFLEQWAATTLCSIPITQPGSQTASFERSRCNFFGRCAGVPYTELHHANRDCNYHGGRVPGRGGPLRTARCRAFTGPRRSEQFE